MRLTIRHVTRYAYTPPASGAVMRLRLFPSQYDTQSVENWAVSVNGEPAPQNHRDGCRVGESVWTGDGPLDAVEVVAEGVVLREEDQGIIRGLKERTPPALFLRQTPLTRPDAAIRDMAEGARGTDDLDTLHNLSTAVRDAVDYQPGSTDFATSASEALIQGAGVCQDHAHVFVAAARSIGLPARYVAGYYLAGATPEDGSPALTETHGWAEGYAEGYGWVGFDIANRTYPTREHVRVACHLDASRAALISGAVTGQFEETLSASVAITQSQQ